MGLGLVTISKRSYVGCRRVADRMAPMSRRHRLETKTTFGGNCDKQSGGVAFAERFCLIIIIIITFVIIIVLVIVTSIA